MYKDVESILEKISQNNQDTRITTQRKIIIKSILAMEGHFSAEEVITEIQRIFPDLIGISKATIYGTLDLLVKNGIITIIQARSFKDEEKGGYFARSYYDRRVDPHINLVCMICGKIEDLNEISLDNILQPINNSSDWELIQQTVCLQAMCKLCKTK
jgi:Fe2+ or Zn2+ uptake regulation protein